MKAGDRFAGFFVVGREIAPPETFCRSSVIGTLRSNNCCYAKSIVEIGIWYT